MSRIFISCVLIVMVLGCGPTEKSPGETTSPKALPENEDDVLIRLSNELIMAPKTQDQIEQNKILNYAIENLLDVQRAPSGMYYKILEAGKGRQPKSGSTVEAHYVGRLLDGTIFDSSYSRGKPQRFNLAEVIPGWRQAIKMLKPEGRGLFLIPSRLAYGEAGLGEVVPPEAVLQFEIELVAVE